MIGSLLRVCFVLASSGVPLLASNSSSSWVSEYDPINDFGEDVYIGESTEEICNSDFVTENSGCVSGELKELGLNFNDYLINHKNDLLFVTDNFSQNKVYLYIYRSDVTQSFNMVSMSNEVEYHEVEKTDTSGKKYKDRIFDDKIQDRLITPVSVSKDGHFVKYEVSDINMKLTDNKERRYLVRQVYNSYSNDDLQSFLVDYENTYMISSNNMIQVVNTETISVTDKVIFFDVLPYDRNFGSLLNGNTTVGRQMFYMFFNTDKDKYFEENGAQVTRAEVQYKTITYDNAAVKSDDDNFEWTWKDVTSVFNERRYSNRYSAWNSTDIIHSYDFDEGLNVDFSSSTYNPPFLGDVGKKAEQELGENPSSTQIWYKIADKLEEHYENDSKFYEHPVSDIQTVVIEPGVSEFTINYNWFLAKTYKYQNLGKVDQGNFNLDFIKENDKKWFIQFHQNDMYMTKMKAEDIRTGSDDAFLMLYNAQDVVDASVNSLQFTLQDGSVEDYIVVDNYTDSIGYKNMLDKPDNGWPDWLVTLIYSLLGIVGLILVIVFLPVGLPAVGAVIKFLFNAVVVLVKCVLWVPYSILVLPFQAISAKRNGEKLEVWNPFK